jgi:Tol biopolymer transport system component
MRPPDGKRTAFIAGCDGNDELHALGVDGSHQTRVSVNGVYRDMPAWSPDGGRIASVHNRLGHESMNPVGADGRGDVRHVREPSAAPVDAH